MKLIVGLFLVVGCLVGMIFLVISTTQYMHVRNTPPPPPEQILMPAAADTLAMYGPPDSVGEKLRAEGADARAAIAREGGRGGPEFALHGPPRGTPSRAPGRRSAAALASVGRLPDEQARGLTASRP